MLIIYHVSCHLPFLFYMTMKFPSDFRLFKHKLPAKHNSRTESKWSAIFMLTACTIKSEYFKRKDTIQHLLFFKKDETAKTYHQSFASTPPTLHSRTSLNYQLVAFEQFMEMQGRARILIWITMLELTSSKSSSHVYIESVVLYSWTSPPHYFPCAWISLVGGDAYVPGEHTASTATLFITFGQGSPPKLSGEMATAHLCFPMHFCSNEHKKHKQVA